MIHRVFTESKEIRYLAIVICLMIAAFTGYTLAQVSVNLQIIFLAFVIAVFTILVENRWLPLVLLMGMSFFSRGVWNVWGDITVADLLFGYMGLRVALALSERRSANILRGNRLLCSLFIWMGLIIAGSIVAIASFPASALSFSVKTIVQQVEFFILCAYLVYFFTPADIRLLTRLEIVSGLGLACVVLYEATHGTIELMGASEVFGSRYSELHRSFTLNPSAILLLIPTFWLVVMLVQRIWLRLPLLMLLLYVFAVSTSRTLYLMLIAGIVIYLGFTRSPRRWIPIALSILLVGSIVWSIVAPEVKEVFWGTRDFLSGQVASGKPLGTTQRILTWLIAFRVMLKSPLFGSGVNGFGLNIHYNPELRLMSPLVPDDWANPTKNLAVQAHSQYFQVLADHGIVGFILFFFFLKDIWRRHKRAWQNATSDYFKRVSLALLVSFSSLLVGFVGHSLLYRIGSNLVQLSFWYNIALILLLEKASCMAKLDEDASNHAYHSEGAHIK